MPLRVNPRQRTVKAVYNTYIDVIHFRKADAKRLRDRDEESAEGYVIVIGTHDVSVQINSIDVHCILYTEQFALKLQIFM